MFARWEKEFHEECWKEEEDQAGSRHLLGQTGEVCVGPPPLIS